MKPSLTLIAALSALACVTFGGVCIASVQYHAIVLFLNYVGNGKASEAAFDNVVKAVSQTAKVSDAQVAKLKKIYVLYAANADKQQLDGSAVRWVRENIPNDDETKAARIRDIIVSGSKVWTEKQKKLVDVTSKYNGLWDCFLANFVLELLHFQKIVPEVSAAAFAEKAFGTK